MAKRLLKRSREQIIRRRILILAAVAAVLLCLLAAWSLIVRKPMLPAAATPEPGIAQGTNPGTFLSGDRKKDFFTFLVVGRDSGGGGNTDTIMVVAYDVPNQKIDILNIFRDTMVNVPWEIKRINSVYNVLAIDGLKEQVGKLIGFVPDYYIKVELDAFGELVDAVGGVDFEIPNDMNYDDPTQDLYIHFNEGMQHLSGDDAMRVIRWRKNNDGSGISVGDIGRVEIQQDFIKALTKQCLKIGNITKVGEFARIFSTRVDSDLTIGELIWFGQQALGMDSESLNFHTLPANYNGRVWSTSYHNYQSYVLPNADEIAQLVNTYLNPYYADVTTDMMDIMSINSDGSLSASGGELADEKAGFPPVISTPKPVETPQPDAEAIGDTVESPAPEESTIPEETSGTGEEEQPVESPPQEITPTPQPTSDMLPVMPAPAGT